MNETQTPEFADNDLAYIATTCRGCRGRFEEEQLFVGLCSQCGAPRTPAEISKQYAGKHCCLDGRRATIYGAGLRFAFVGICDDGPPAHHVEFSWPAVQRIMESSHCFQS